MLPDSPGPKDKTFAPRRRRDTEKSKKKKNGFVFLRKFGSLNACDKQNFRVLEFLLEREVRNIQAPVFGCHQKSAVQIGPHLFPLSPYYHAQNSCFLAQIWVTGRIPATSELSCPRISAGERNPKYPGSGFGRNQESAVRIEPIYFRFLRASVPPWCKGLVFGCGLVAPCLRGAKVLFLRFAAARMHSLESAS